MRKVILFLSLILSTAYTNLHAQAPKASSNAQTVVALNYDKEKYTINEFLAHQPVIRNAQLVEPSGSLVETYSNPKDLKAEVTFLPTGGDPVQYKSLSMLFDAKNKSYIQQLMKNGGKVTFTNLEVTTSKGKQKAVNPYTFIIAPQQ